MAGSGSDDELGGPCSGGYSDYDLCDTFAEERQECVGSMRNAYDVSTKLRIQERVKPLEGANDY